MAAISVPRSLPPITNDRLDSAPVGSFRRSRSPRICCATASASPTVPATAAAAANAIEASPVRMALLPEAQGPSVSGRQGSVSGYAREHGAVNDFLRSQRPMPECIRLPAQLTAYIGMGDRD